MICTFYKGLDDDLLSSYSLTLHRRKANTPQALLRMFRSCLVEDIQAIKLLSCALDVPNANFIFI